MARYSIYKVEPENLKDIVGGNIEYKPILKIVFADISTEYAGQLAALGYNVKLVQEISVKRSIRPAQIVPPSPIPGAQATYTAQDLLASVGLDKAREAFDTPVFGAGYTIAVLDTGIRKTHIDMARVTVEIDYTGEGNTDDNYDHGTGVASLISAAAPLVSLLNFKVMGRDGSGSEESMVSAMEHILSMAENDDPNTPTFVNISAGTEDTGDVNDILRVACRALIDAGVFICAAAGNDGPTPGTVMNPACERYVAAVGSVNVVDLRVSTWSSRGPTKEGLIKPDVVFFGEDISVASSASDTATVAKSGTSFSAPLLTGIVVIAIEAYAQKHQIPLPYKGSGVNLPVLSMEDLLDKWTPLISVKSKDVFTSGKDNNVGWGLPFGDLLVQLLSSSTSTAITSIVGSIVGVMIMMMMVVSISKMVNQNKGVLEGLEESNESNELKRIKARQKELEKQIAEQKKRLLGGRPSPLALPQTSM